jgi:basic membrane protein A
VWAIGVDNDQGFLGPHVLTSAVKRVDVGVETTIRQVVEEVFTGGSDGVFDIGNDGVGYGNVSSRAPDREALVAELERWRARIASGEVEPPRTPS